ncbi:hypothetical protein BPUTSESOX_552 [uncultured Gammaproteobacteria bacterium]|nr:hypothetical protein BPUTSESOX_552 [uncultured Gammaproteobacteria bacterium]
MVDLSRVIVGFIVINQFVVWFLRVDYLKSVHIEFTAPEFVLYLD